MNLGQLISRFRIEAYDMVQPYFWPDDAVTGWLNDAVEEAAIRGRLIYGKSQIGIVSGQTVYDLPDRLYELVSLFCADAGDTDIHRRWPLALVSPEVALKMGLNRTRLDSKPQHVIQDDNRITLAATPEHAYSLFIEGYRLPLTDMTSIADEPEINPAHHRHLVNWVLHKAFSIPDTEAFDPDRAQMAETQFTQYFGMRPDSDLRRTTREDVPHQVDVFWP